ncbi:hypothetical protein CVD28_17565 [Bacillus sp. M6-12]|uniref:vWA domain-containing protein n=1 Tax=Bacillus sp. M6-12 TaxID=2054166 RepID=UPI000C78608B|nr:VWA domain-containing protein [Bacillus sp. M6-12]PLS16285.1 hypothetical protein CVD28_17565 [Bacillus sp. M6-12]
MKKLLPLIAILILIITGCGKAEEKAEAEAKKAPAEVTDKKKEAAADKEENSKEWPDSFKPEKDFSVPQTLEEAEKMTPGEWWEKIEDNEWNDSDQIKLAEKIGEIDSLDISEEKRADRVTQLIFKSIYPELPGLGSYQPRENISLETLDTGSNLKLNGREVKENINVAIILDASGSMNAKQGSKTKMEIAKEAINGFVTNLPDNTKVSFTIYGHKGTGDDKDKELSCSSVEEIYPMSAYNASSFGTVLNTVKPSGWTPIAASLTHAGEKLKSFDSASNTNIIYLVSDGKETCDGKPQEVAANLAKSNIQPIINVIGFGVDQSDRSSLETIASSAGGRYISAENQADLEEEFEKSNDSIGKWISWSNEHTSDAINQSNEDTSDLISLNNKTTSRLIAFDNTATSVLIRANNEYHMDPDVYDLVNETIDDFYREIKDQADDDYRAKKEKVDETYKTTKDTIDQTYEQNTGN